MNDFIGNLNPTQKKLVTAILALIVYVIATAGSFSMFSAINAKNAVNSGDLDTSLPTATAALDEDPKAPKTEQCPLDGDMHSKKARDYWELRRPLAVMIENHEESRPQSGLSSADIVYEAIAEGGITRFMAVYLCNLADAQVGPVRSARTYFVDWLSEYDALYAHVGGANTPGPANALQQIIDYEIKDLDQRGISYPTFWRDYNRLGRPVATEHTMYSTTQKLWEKGSQRGWTATDSAGLRWDKNFVPWKFADGQGGGTVAKISVPFWANQGAYNVEWNYDATCNCYKRLNGGTPHNDLNNNQQLSPKNVVVQFQTEGRANDGYEGNLHMIYGTKGTGDALIFQNGKVIKGKWAKPNRLSRTKYTDETGKEVSFVKGQIWIQTVAVGNDITY